MQIEAEFPEKLQCLFRPSRYKFIRGGRGSSKSWSIARALLIKAAAQPLRILCTREVQKSLKESVHQLLEDQVSNLGLEGFYQVLNTEIRGNNGSEFLFAGLSDLTATSIKSFEGCDIVWLEEAQTITKKSLKILIPTIRKDGSEIWASYNPELETDPIHEMAVVNPPPDTISVEVNYSDNPWFPRVLEQERLHAKATMPEAEYAHIWEGRCKPAVEGAIYATEIAVAEKQGRFGRVPYDPMLKAHVIWDLGWNDAMAIIIAQRAASEIRIIDYIEDSHLALPDYVITAKDRPWDRDWKPLDDRGLNWGKCWLPHDGFTKRHQTGKSDDQVLEGLNWSVERTPNIEVEQGIRNARLVFPRIWFNNESEGVKRLIQCLKRYRRNINQQTREATTPRHDEYSHGADAFRYLCLVADQLSNSAPAINISIPRWAG